MKITFTFNNFFGWTFLFIGVGLCAIYWGERSKRDFPTKFGVRGTEFAVTWYEKEFVVVKKGDPRVQFEDNITGSYDCETAQEGFARLVDVNKDGRRDFFYYQPCGDDQRRLVYDPIENTLTSEIVRPDTDRSLLGWWGREVKTFPWWMLVFGVLSLGLAGYEFLFRSPSPKETDGE